MKSEPGRSVVCTSTFTGGEVSAATSFALRDGAAARRASDCCALAASGFTANTVAPAAAPFKKPRRSTEPFLDLAIFRPLTTSPFYP